MPDPLPSGDLPRFGDPTDLNLLECVAWIDVFSRYQNDAPREKCFQFDQVIASVSHKWPSWAAPSTKENFRRGNTDAILVRYNSFLERPQRVEPIRYPEDTWEFVHFTRNGSSTELWNGLPGGREQQTLAVIPDSEAKVYESWLQGLTPEDEEVSALVRNCVAKVNEMETLLPLIVSNFSLLSC